MEKVLVKEKLGGDGGQVALVVENGELQLMVSYPVVKVLQPIKDKVVDKLKAIIPGDKYDFVVDKGWEALLDVFGMAKKVSPALADIDLRGILYVSREHASIITPEDKLSSDASGLLEALLTTPDTALDHLERLKPLSRAEKSIMMLRILERAKPVQVWGTPPILNACMALAKAEPELGSQLYAFLEDRPPGQIQASLIPKIRDESWANSLFQDWTNDAEISAPVKAAIKELNKAKKV